MRNWDYRYCWLRDAAYTLWALNIGGYTDEARAWRNWLLRAAGGDPDNLQVLYGVTGESRLPEFELDWLPGYEDSRRSASATRRSSQFQLDVYGEVVDALHLAASSGSRPDEAAWTLERHLVEYVIEHWREPDEGIWEVRGPRRHFTHSKVFAWVALDRAVERSRSSASRARSSAGARCATRSAPTCSTKGFDAERKTFIQYYGSKELDASLLMIPLVHFLPATDPRMRGTVEAIKRELMRDGLVLRYRSDQTDDGLPPGEGTFLACTFWLVDNLALMGGLEEATEIYERLLGAAQRCRAAGRGVGPQARPTGRQLPAGADPRRPGQLGVQPRSRPQVARTCASLGLN